MDLQYSFRLLVLCCVFSVHKCSSQALTAYVLAVSGKRWIILGHCTGRDGCPDTSCLTGPWPMKVGLLSLDLVRMRCALLTGMPNACGRKPTQPHTDTPRQLLSSHCDQHQHNPAFMQLPAQWRIMHINSNDPSPALSGLVLQEVRSSVKLVTCASVSTGSVASQLDALNALSSSKSGHLYPDTNIQPSGSRPTKLWGRLAGKYHTSPAARTAL
jgi:hypothetical protein